MQQRTRILLLGFALLGGLAAYWWWSSQKQPPTSTLGQDRLFRIANTDRIHKIFMAHRDGETVTLERQGRHWIYNGQYRARQNAMDNLLHAIQNVQVKYKPPRAAVPNMVEDLATFGIKVELYNARDELLKAYYVGGGTADERGTHIIMEGAEQPYVAHIPGWQGNLRFRYQLTGDDWRDKTVFGASVDEIRSVSVAYPRQRSKSFRLEKAGPDYSITPFYRTSPSLGDTPVAGRAEQFLYGFSNLGAEAFENKNPRRDSIVQTLPFSIIRLERTNGQVKTVRLYPVLPLTTIWDDTQPIPNSPIERYFAATESGDFLLVQHRVFQRILWPYERFFAKAQ